MLNILRTIRIQAPKSVALIGYGEGSTTRWIRAGEI